MDKEGICDRIMALKRHFKVSYSAHLAKGLYRSLSLARDSGLWKGNAWGLVLSVGLGALALAGFVFERPAAGCTPEANAQGVGAGPSPSGVAYFLRGVCTAQGVQVAIDREEAREHTEKY